MGLVEDWHQSERRFVLLIRPVLSTGTTLEMTENALTRKGNKLLLVLPEGKCSPKELQKAPT